MAHPPNTEQGHICIKCGGEFLIGLSEPGIVHVDYVYLQPGAAGRFVRQRPSLLFRLQRTRVGPAALTALVVGAGGGPVPEGGR